MKKQKGSAVITTPIVIGVGMMFISLSIVTIVKIVMPYIVYEKMASTTLKYVFVMEEYGYLTKKEATLLLDELEQQGLERKKIQLDYTSKKVKYGDEIYLKINYDYPLKLPTMETNTIPMKIEKYSICKR